MSEFLIIKNIIANDVNFEQNFCVAGNFPAISSFLGMVHATIRQITGIKDLSVCPIIHYSEKYNGYEKTIPTLEEVSGNKGASLLESIKGTIGFSLIIEINTNIDYDVTNIKQDIYNVLKSKTLAGGIILFNKEDILYTRDIENLLSNAKKIRAGRMISDVTELLFNDDSNVDKLDELIDITQISKDIEDNILPNKYDGYLLPIAIGYAGLEIPKNRQGRQGDVLHSFVEPVIGLADIIVFSHKKTDKLLDKKVFWSYEYNKINHTYLCVGKNI